MIKYNLLFVLILLYVQNNLMGQEIKPISITINTNETYQTIHSFGASDCWRCRFVGLNWPIKKREKIAELLFSKAYDSNGNPKGIGLSMWRFNIGAGSAEQGMSSRIRNEWRRGESFFNQDYSGYDWNKQAGQQWFLSKATDYKVENLLVFANSPPVQYTLNGKAFADKGLKRLNLKSEHYNDFAQYLVDVANHFNENSIPINYISPLNEPQWDWDNGNQEGTPANNEEILKLTRALSDKLKQSQSNTKIILTESAELQFISDFELESNTTDSIAQTYKPKADQINYFFNPESEAYVGKLPCVENAIAAHGYFTTWPVSKLITKRQNLAASIKKYNPELAYWQSEFCILEKNDDIVQGNKRDLEMPTALYVARVIHYDLVIANAASWQWWTALSQVDYKDGLIYLDADGAFDNEKLKYDGTIRESKLLWALGNYSRFVRPGMQRVDVEFLKKTEPEDQANQVMVSAFKNENELVLVAINYSNTERPLKIDLNTKSVKKRVKSYITSNTKNLQMVETDFDNISLEPRSVTTIVID